jgi:hypothetical protein
MTIIDEQFIVEDFFFFFLKRMKINGFITFFSLTKVWNFFPKRSDFFSELFEDKKFESLVLKVRKLHFFSPTTKFLSLVKRNFL